MKSIVGFLAIAFLLHLQPCAPLLHLQSQEFPHMAHSLLALKIPTKNMKTAYNVFKWADSSKLQYANFLYFQHFQIISSMNFQNTFKLE